MTKKLIKAIAFAAEKHRNQRRKDKEASPYINHPITLANILANEGGVTDINVIIAPYCTTLSKIQKQLMMKFELNLAKELQLLS